MPIQLSTGVEDAIIQDGISYAKGELDCHTTLRYVCNNGFAFSDAKSIIIARGIFALRSNLSIYLLLFLFFFLFLFAFTQSTHATGRETHGISLFGDLKYRWNFKHFDYVNPQAPKSGSIEYGVVGSFNSLNSYILKGSAATGLDMIYDTLMVSSADEPFSQYGLIARSAEIAEDRSWIIFNLRPQAKWHDGKKITSEDVVFTFNTLKNKGHPFYRSYYREVEKAEALGKYRVKFSFATGGNRELPLIIGQLPVLPKHYYETQPFNKSTLTPPLGSGPYRVKSADAGKSVTFERVPEYWGRYLPVNKGRYNFDKVKYSYYRDTTVAVEAFKAGEYDLRAENVAKIWATAYDIPAVKNGLIKKEAVPDERPTGMQGFIINTRREKFKDPRVREALNYAFDFEWENKTFFFDSYSRTRSYFSNSEYAAKGLPSKDELKFLEPLRDQIKDERVFTTPFSVPITDGSGDVRPNLLIARDLLKEAGWVVKDFKLVNKETGEPFTLEFLISSPSFERVIAPMVKNLQRLGIEATIRKIDSAQYEKNLQSFDFDITVYVYSSSASPGNEQLDYWHSRNVNVQGSRNMSGVNDPVVDMLVEKVVNASSKKELIAATRALDRVLLYGFYVIPNWHIQSYRLIYWNKFERPSIVPKYSLALESWWAKK